MVNASTGPSGLRLLILIAAALSTALPVLAQAQVGLGLGPIPQPIPPYLNSTKELPITGTDFTITGGVTDGTQTVTFSTPFTVQDVPAGGWLTWNSPPNTESSTPRVLADFGYTSGNVTLTLTQPSYIFGFETEPNAFASFNVTATFMSGSTVLGSVTRLINGDAGALLAASSVFQPITSVNISWDPGTGGFAIAALRYSLAFAPPADAYQIHSFSNTSSGNQYIDITNAGTAGAGLSAGTTASVTGAICVNAYAFAADEQLVACCSCPVTPNGAGELSVPNDLLSNVLEPQLTTNGITVVLTATAPNTSFTCSGNAYDTGFYVPGLVAFGTTLHANTSKAPSTLQETGSPFVPKSLSLSEAERMTELCAFVNANGSGSGICNSCQVGALAASKQ